MKSHFVSSTSYLLSSSATILLNKVILNSYKFKMHHLFTFLQSLIITFIVLFLFAFKFTKINFRNISSWTSQAILLTLMIFTGMKALYYLPMSLFILLKNITLIPIALGELLFSNKRIGILGYFSFILIIGSSYTGVEGHSVPGYLWMVFNIMSSTAYILYLKIIIRRETSSKMESVFFTNLLTLPFLLIISVFYDKWDYSYQNKGIVPFLIALSSFFAFLTSFSTSWALQCLGSTSVSMLGALSKLFLSASGFLIFHENFTFRKLISIFVGIAAGLLYTYDSVTKNSKKIEENEQVKNVP